LVKPTVLKPGWWHLVLESWRRSN